MSAVNIGQPHLFEPPPALTLTLRDKFLVPPFSVLDARAGYWQERKQAWLNLGIQGEIGRADNLTWGDSEEITSPGLNYYRDKKKAEAGREFALLAEQETGDVKGGIDSAQGRSGNLIHKGAVREKLGGQWDVSKGEAAYGKSGTSVFDPVLCELAYRWFSPEGGLVADPFAGGSVRGIVAAALGRRYVGTDLSLPQVEANYQQVAPIKRAVEGWAHDPRWEHADARNFLEHCDRNTADLIFTCPPYYDLEVYSDDPFDLSAAPTYAGFLEGYRECIVAAARALRDDRFAIFVVGEVRDKKTGRYVGLVPDTIRACEDAGLSFYNEGILVTSVGSLPVRTSRIFGPGRKLGKTHQNVLCFVKGSWSAAAAACPMPEEVAVEYGGAVWHADSVVEAPSGEAEDLGEDILF